MNEIKKIDHDEMRKRKERMELWREKMKLQGPPKTTSSFQLSSSEASVTKPNHQENISLKFSTIKPKFTLNHAKKTTSVVKFPSLGNSLGDDEDSNNSNVGPQKKKIRRLSEDEDEPKPNSSTCSFSKNSESSRAEKPILGEDPLDAYMEEIHGEVEKIIASGSAGKRQSFQVMGKNQEDEEESEEDGEENVKGNPEDDITLQMEKLKNLQNRKHTGVLVDHSKIDYAPFRKDFYVEVPDISKMTAQEVEEYRQSMDSMKVRGKDMIKPIKNWAQCGLSTKILDVIKTLKYEKPMPIQAQAMPAIMSGRDFIGIAATGSGKTIAFLLPMFRHILDQPPLEVGDGPIGVIMTPTRELAVQIFVECRRFTRKLGLTAVCVYGGTGVSEQIADLKRGAEIIVCTPGRMIDMLAVNSGKVTNLRRVTYLVLDEADRMFDMGFEPQVKSIVNNTRPDRQTVLFSATFPTQMQKLAMSVLQNPIEVIVGGRSRVCDDITQNMVIITEDDKFLKLLELLGHWYEKGSILVFVERQEKADKLLKELIRVGYPCLTLHGGMDQNDRDSTIADFKNGCISILVATSVAARGLDVRGLNLVVNYDVPNHYEDYVHRVGRTGRAGNKGTAYTFITNEEAKYAGELMKALKLAESELPEDLKKMWQDFREENKDGNLRLSSGFGGKGFKFDASENAKRDEARKAQKQSLGLQESDEEAEGEEDQDSDLDDEIEKKMAGQGSATGTKIRKVENVAENSTSVSSAISKVQSVVSSFVAQKQAAESSYMKGSNLAAQVASNINMKMKMNPSGSNYDPNEELPPAPCEIVPHHFEAELEINDFPRTARYRVTNKEAVLTIQEFSGASITIRGNYYEAGKQPTKVGDRKLYLFIEGDTEHKVEICKAEIKRIIKEQIHHEMGRQKSGRYKVI